MNKKTLVYVLAALLCLAAATLLVLRMSLPGEKPAPAPTPETEILPTPEAQIAERRIDGSAISAKIDEICPPGSGSWDIYLEDLQSGEIFGSSSVSPEKEVSASLIKLFIMGAVYGRIADGSFDRGSVYPLVYSMITVSSNEAANELTKLLGSGSEENGMAEVNAFAASLGCTDTRMNRLMLVQNGLQNYTTAADCARFLRMLYSGSLISPDFSAEMIGILRDQQINDRIPALLPEGTSVAHKTGDLLDTVFGDAGIVFTPQGDYILCIICENPPDYEPTLNKIARLSEFIFDNFYS